MNRQTELVEKEKICANVTQETVPKLGDFHAPRK
jgi:hypothetical protein